MINFPDMTNSQRQQMVNWLEEGIACRDEYGFGGNVLKSMQIALAALTAETHYHTFVGNYYTAPPAPVLKPIELNKGALMISAYTTDPMNEDPVLCLSKDGVIEAIRAAGYEVKP